MNDMASRTGRFMHTSNGKKFWPLDPKPHEVHIEVIAHHLANRCRYNGATQHPTDPARIFYSVAEHSVYCSYIGTPEEALERLLHDASEAYNGDLIRPLKYDPMFSAPFKHVEDLNENAVALRYGLVYPYPASVKVADEAVTSAEINQIITKAPDEDWGVKLHDDAKVAPIDVQCLYPHQAKKFFLHRFNQLWDSEKNWRRPARGANAFGCYEI